MKMDLDACADFLLKNENKIQPEKMEKAIGLMDFLVEVCEAWNEDMRFYFENSMLSEDELEEEFNDGKQEAYTVAKTAIENRLSDYVLMLKKEIEEKNKK